MPTKKSKSTKKARKMHAAKKLESVQPLTVETNLISAGTGTAAPPSTISSHTGVIDGNSLSWGIGRAPKP